MNIRQHAAIGMALLAAGCACVCGDAAQSDAENRLNNEIPRVFAAADGQLRLLLDNMAKSGASNCFPKRWQDGKLQTIKPTDWCSGFFPGTLWWMYDYTRNEFWKTEAERYTAIQDQIRHFTGNHDIGFMMMTSVGQALRLAPKPEYKAILSDAAAALEKRYEPKLGLVRSWGKIGDNKTFLVIIDNMMNLELWEWAGKNGCGDKYLAYAKSHADNTDAHHFRADGSAFHVLNYDQSWPGKIQEYRAGQGASASGTWSRGHSWAIYGFTMMFRETGDKAYLKRAMSAADYAINHPNMPEDGIPYWDYYAPGIPQEERDASAGAIMASGLIELSALTPCKKAAARYRAFAVKQLLSLASPAYMCAPGSHGGFLLDHSVGSKPGFIHSGSGGEVDVPLNYADYYFLEGLMRFRSLAQKGN